MILERTEFISFVIEFFKNVLMFIKCCYYSFNSALTLLGAMLCNIPRLSVSAIVFLHCLCYVMYWGVINFGLTYSPRTRNFRY